MEGDSAEHSHYGLPQAVDIIEWRYLEFHDWLYSFLAMWL